MYCSARLDSTERAFHQTPPVATNASAATGTATSHMPDSSASHAKEAPERKQPELANNHRRRVVW